MILRSCKLPIMFRPFGKMVFKGIDYHSLGKFLGGISAGTEEFLEVTRPGQNSFYDIDFSLKKSSKLDKYFSNQ